MGYYNFDKDLLESQKDFKIISKFLLSKGATNIIENHDKRFDISFVLGKEYTIEIKHDYKYSQTGNIAIEFESRGKPSGISTSIANLWGYILGDDFYVMTINSLKKMINDNNFKSVKGGDDYSSKMYLVPFEKFKNFKRFSLI